MEERNSRDRIIIRTSIIGIAANALLAAMDTDFSEAD